MGLEATVWLDRRTGPRVTTIVGGGIGLSHGLSGGQYVMYADVALFGVRITLPGFMYSSPQHACSLRSVGLYGTCGLMGAWKGSRLLLTVRHAETGGGTSGITLV